METFRTGAKVVRLNVNDDGYCVELNVSSDLWIKRFLDYANEMYESEKKHTTGIGDDVDAQIAALVALDEDAKAGFKRLFGEESYEEVFGQELVGIEYVIEFLEACIPYVEKRIDHREKAMDKYSPDKTGGAR